MNRNVNLTKVMLQLTAIVFMMASIIAAKGASPGKCNHGNRACFEDGTVVPNLYLYSKDYLNRYFKQNKLDYSIDTIGTVEKNPSETYLYVREWLTKRGFLISPGGKARLIDNPEGYEVLDDTGALKEINYKKDSGNAHFLSDISGEYFLSCNGRMKNVELRSIADPDKIVGRSNLGANRMFYFNGRIYLFGSDKSSLDKHGFIKDIVCQIFKKTGEGLDMESEIRIPRPVAGPTPFHVEDIDPLTKNVVLRDVRDWPSDSFYRLYNLDSRVMRTIYLPDDYAYPVFLREDILGTVR